MNDPDVVAQIDACEIADGVGDIIIPRWLVLRARDEIVALRDALRDCMMDLAEEIEDRYRGRLTYPSELTRYKSDMEPVNAARRLLGEAMGDE